MFVSTLLLFLNCQTCLRFGKYQTPPTCAVVGVGNVLDVVKHETCGGVRQEVQSTVLELHGGAAINGERLRREKKLITQFDRKSVTQFILRHATLSMHVELTVSALKLSFL